MINRFLANIVDKDTDIPLIAITGLCKNAGKTTLLNWLTSKIESDRGVVLMTTGRDGEDIDQLGGHEKPKVDIPSGTIFVTHDGILSQFEDRVEVLEKTKYKAGPYQVWVARALDSIKTEIIGPSTAKEQIELCNRLKKYNPSIIFIDGSLDRKAITLHPDIDGILLVLSANFGTLEEIITEFDRLLLLTEIRKSRQDINEFDKVNLVKGGKRVKCWDSLLGNEAEVVAVIKDLEPEEILIPGVITSPVWEKLKNTLLKFKGQVIVNNPYQLQVRKFDLDTILERVDIYCRNEFVINGVALNSYSVKGRHLDVDQFRKRIRAITKIPIIDSMEIVK
jgi:hypothetical protein